MHKKHPQKFSPVHGVRDHFSFIFVVFDKVGHCFFCHADDTAIADRNPMGIPSKISDNRIRPIKSFFDIYDPIFCIKFIE